MRKVIRMLLYAAAEPAPLWETALYMVLGMIVLFALMGVGAYLLIRLIAHYLNARRDSWADTANSLGLSPDQSRGVMLKTLTGKRGEYNVTVEPYAVQTGKYSSDAHASVEVPLRVPLDFSFKISKPEMLHHVVANYFSSNEAQIGFDVFDKAFNIDCSHVESLRELLHHEMLDGQSSTLLTDLMLANKRYHRVTVTDTAIQLGVKAELHDSSKIETAITKAIYLADRIDNAKRRLAERT